MTLRYASVCSGIEATSVAWDPLGLRPAFFAEIDDFCSAILAHRFPEVPNLGDFTKIGPEHGPVDVLVGGPPCQSFSDAGGRAGLRDPRGQLAIEFLRLAARLQAKWVVFENVPGLLHSGDGEGPEDDEASDDGGGRGGERRTFLGTMGQLGFGFAYRILDAQHFGVPQRRRRVIVVGRAGGNWRAAASVLFERESLRGTAAPRRAARSDAAGTAQASVADGDRDADVAFALATNSRLDANNENLVVAPCLMSPYADHGHQGQLVYNVSPLSASVEPNTLVARPTQMAEALTAMGPQRRCDRGDLVVIPLQSVQATHSAQGGVGVGGVGDPSYTLTSRHDMGAFIQEPISFDPAQVTHPENRSRCAPGQAAPTLAATGRPHVAHQSFVRRLTPLEYERLQGFPDGWTDIPWKGKAAPDGRRYKATGNSMAVPVMRWIGARILLVDRLLRDGV